MTVEVCDKLPRIRSLRYLSYRDNGAGASAQELRKEAERAVVRANVVLNRHTRQEDDHGSIETGNPKYP